MNNETDFDTSETTNGVCPYCGFEDPNFWELEEDFDTTYCRECKKTFHYERHTSITYTTKII